MVAATAVLAAGAVATPRTPLGAVGVVPACLRPRLALPAARVAAPAGPAVVPVRPLAVSGALAPDAALAAAPLALLVRSPLAPVPSGVAAPVTARAAITAPSGAGPRRSRLAATLVALTASCRATTWPTISIMGSTAAAVAIFSRAVIAGTIRDTHL
ncbi:hypothetical protein BJF90_45620 [Pseudonocardia sp. CNS-004]|nr:hypothetical protein BJF90_45620 [Pseudonocardia sp. CNS-004]